MAGVIVAGLLVVALGWIVHPVPSTTTAYATLLYLAVGTQIAALRPIPWRRGHQSVVDPLLVAAGLYAPRGGVGMICRRGGFYGREPGRTIRWGCVLFHR